MFPFFLFAVVDTECPFSTKHQKANGTFEDEDEEEARIEAELRQLKEEEDEEGQDDEEAHLRAELARLQQEIER